MFGLGFGSFLGFTISEALIPHYILKTNPDASQLLWSSYSNGDSEIYGGIVLNGSELGLTSYCGNNNFTWGNQTMNGNNGCLGAIYGVGLGVEGVGVVKYLIVG